MSETAVESLSAQKVTELARAGDVATLSAFERSGYWLGIGLASLTDTLNIQAVIIGGGVSASFDLLLPTLQRTVQQHCFRRYMRGWSLKRPDWETMPVYSAGRHWRVTICWQPEGHERV